MGLVAEQVITERYALYLGDCMEVLAGVPDGAIHLSLYSPPFATERGGALYHYTSSERDLSNSRSFAEFQEHYGFVVAELFRVTMPGRMSCVHCMDIPRSNTGRGDSLMDFPGEIIRLHEQLGWRYVGRYHVWKEPLTVRNRTLTKGLAHRTIVDDSSRCSVANADYLLVFRREGENPVPIARPTGFLEYAGEREMPADIRHYRGWQGDQKQNKYSHWIWRRYASAFWDDIRLDRVLPYEAARDAEDERHVHALQLDVIERVLALWSNPGERVCDPFGGVGSTPFGAVRAGRFGIASEIKPSYFRQMVRNLVSAAADAEQAQMDMFAHVDVESAGVAIS